MALKDIIFRVLANTKGAEANMDKLKKRSEDLASSFKKMGATLGIAFGAKAVLENFLQQEKALTQLNTVLKSTGGAAGVTANEMISLAKSLSDVTRFSDESIIGVENILLTFTKIGKDVLPDAIETVLNMAEALGTDLKGQSIQLGKALNDPIVGVSALREVGVSLTEQQIKMAKSFAEAGDMASAQKVILDELAIEFGNSARAAGDTFGGGLDKATNRLFDLTSEIMQGLVPALNVLLSVVTPIITFFSTGFNAASKNLQRLTQDMNEVGLFGKSMNEILKQNEERGVGIQRIAYEMKLLGINTKETSTEVKNLDGNFANFVRGAVSEFNSLKQTVKGIFGDIGKEITDWIDINVARTKIKQLREELAKPLTEQQKLQIEINKLEKELADKLAGNVAAREKSLIITNKQIEEEIKALELAKSKTTEIREQWLYQQKILELQKELRKQILPPGVVEARQPEAGTGTLRGPAEVSRAEVSILPTEAELREKFKTFDIIAETSAQTFKETFSGILDGLFGDNSILQKLLSKTFGGFLDQMASSLGSPIFSGLLSLLPGGDLLSGLASMASPALSKAGGGTLMIQNNIAGEEINTVMVDLVPTALNRAVRLRRA